MSEVSAYQRVVCTDGRRFVLHAPRYMHIVTGRVLRGTMVSEIDGSMQGEQIVIPDEQILQNHAALWTGDQWIDAPDLVAWSDQ